MRSVIIKHLPRALCSLAITLLIAWAAACFSPITSGSFQPAPAGGDWPSGRFRVPSDWTPRTWLVRSGPGLRHDLLSESIWMGSTLGSTQATAPNRTMQFVSVGWPFPALAWTIDPSPAPRGHLAHAWQSGLPFTGLLGTGHPRRLPIRPSWAGLILDVAAFWLILSWLSQRLVLRRARLAIARGLCTACGYSRVGIARESPCPECGAPGPAATPA